MPSKDPPVVSAEVKLTDRGQLLMDIRNNTDHLPSGGRSVIYSLRASHPQFFRYAGVVDESLVIESPLSRSRHRSEHDSSDQSHSDYSSFLKSAEKKTSLPINGTGRHAYKVAGAGSPALVRVLPRSGAVGQISSTSRVSDQRVPMSPPSQEAVLTVDGIEVEDFADGVLLPGERRMLLLQVDGPLLLGRPLDVLQASDGPSSALCSPSRSAPKPELQCRVPTLAGSGDNLLTVSNSHSTRGRNGHSNSVTESGTQGEDSAVNTLREPTHPEHQLGSPMSDESTRIGYAYGAIRRISPTSIDPSSCGPVPSQSQGLGSHKTGSSHPSTQEGVGLPHSSTQSAAVSSELRVSWRGSSAGGQSRPFFYVYYERLGDEDRCVDAARAWCAKQRAQWRAAVSKLLRGPRGGHAGDSDVALPPADAGIPSGRSWNFQYGLKHSKKRRKNPPKGDVSPWKSSSAASGKGSDNASVQTATDVSGRTSPCAPRAASTSVRERYLRELRWRTLGQPVRWKNCSSEGSSGISTMLPLAEYDSSAMKAARKIFSGKDYGGSGCSILPFSAEVYARGLTVSTAGSQVGEAPRVATVDGNHATAPRISITPPDTPASSCSYLSAGKPHTWGLRRFDSPEAKGGSDAQRQLRQPRDVHWKVSSTGIMEDPRPPSLPSPSDSLRNLHRSSTCAPRGPNGEIFCSSEMDGIASANARFFNQPKGAGPHDQGSKAMRNSCGRRMRSDITVKMLDSTTKCAPQSVSSMSPSDGPRGDSSEMVPSISDTGCHSSLAQLRYQPAWDVHEGAKPAQQDPFSSSLCDSESCPNPAWDQPGNGTTKSDGLATLGGLLPFGLGTLSSWVSGSLENDLGRDENEAEHAEASATSHTAHHQRSLACGGDDCACFSKAGSSVGNQGNGGPCLAADTPLMSYDSPLRDRSAAIPARNTLRSGLIDSIAPKGGSNASSFKNQRYPTQQKGSELDACYSLKSGRIDGITPSGSMKGSLAGDHPDDAMFVVNCSASFTSGNLAASQRERGDRAAPGDGSQGFLDRTGVAALVDTATYAKVWEAKGADQLRAIAALVVRLWQEHCAEPYGTAEAFVVSSVIPKATAVLHWGWSLLANTLLPMMFSALTLVSELVGSSASIIRLVTLPVVMLTCFWIMGHLLFGGYGGSGPLETSLGSDVDLMLGSWM